MSREESGFWLLAAFVLLAGALAGLGWLADWLGRKWPEVDRRKERR